MDNYQRRFDIIKNSLILIVDDIPENIEILGATLKAKELQISVATDGMQAIRIATTIFPDLILLDISMPGLDGLEVLNRLKKLPETKDIPVILLTARTDSADVIKGFKAGCVDYVTKPFNPAELTARIFTQLELKKSREDIELRKASERRIKSAMERAEELNRLKSSLIGNMSHEFRTPLIGIIGYSQFLLDLVKDDEQLQMVNAINFSGVRLLTTLNSILRLSELEAGRLKANLEDYEINKTVETVVGYFNFEAREKQLTLNFIPDQRRLWGCIDKTLYDQVLIYIIDNAIKYTEKGTVSVEVFRETGKNNNSWITAKVTDTGIGIDQKSQEIIFEEFRQESEGFTRNYEGSGLGLTLANKMINLMNGQISLSSSPGCGSDFYIRVPAVEINT